MTRSRGKSQGRRQFGNRFAMLPVDLLEDPAVTTLSHAGFRVMALVAAGYSGANNGAMACTDTWVRRFGLNGRDTVYRCLKDLVSRGLLEVTRPGIKHRKIPTLYAVTWQMINYRDCNLLDRPEPASYRYHQWVHDKPKTPKRTPRRFKSGTTFPPIQNVEALTAENHTDQRESVTPLDGVHDVFNTPTALASPQSCTPDIGNTLRIWTGDSDLTSEESIKTFIEGQSNKFDPSES